MTTTELETIRRQMNRKLRAQGLGEISLNFLKLHIAKVGIDTVKGGL
jgi:hypothetical protein